MIRLLQSVSGFYFYVLGISFFAAYLLFRNDMNALEAAWWMQRADLPMALVTLLYGGTSFYLSLRRDGSFSVWLVIVTFLPLIAIFIGLTILNFWDVLPVEQGEMFL